ncbi:carboxymuconolactone decarboxylase family protein [Micromonospora sp. NPDC005203]|uniref:carboxymuconolactone decarboxylase family protein n=1 Tax=Micromonospora sp. NPDC005203 TaxID=3364226 RepID=UPI00369A303A
MTYRFTTPVQASAATGWTAEVYRQMSDDFLGPLPTFQVLAAVPEVLAATWALMREALLAGDASRVERELVAAAVSRANRCRFCLDAHAMLLHALGEPKLAEVIVRDGTPPQPGYAALVDWAQASRNPTASDWTSPYRPEVTGTLLAFHVINRIVSALLDPDLLPGGLQRSPLVRSVGTRIALLAAFAPSAITVGDVALWRLSHPGDADLVRLVAYGAITATEHIAQALTSAHPLGDHHA